jgi:hypothetical protein
MKTSIQGGKMDDKPALPNMELEPPTGVSDDSPERIESSQSNGSSDLHQGTFDEQFSEATELFGNACERYGIDVAFVVAKDPKTGGPGVFIRGHDYDAISLAARVLKRIQQEMMAELMGEVAE